MNKKILLWLIKNNFKFTNRGILYLADAIYIYHTNSQINICDIYEKVAANYYVSSRSVIRCMTHAIKTQWNNTEFTKYTVTPPKVSEAIYLLELVYFDGDENEN